MKSYLFGGECCLLGMTKNNKKMGFFSLLQPNQTLRQKEKWYTCVSFVHQFVSWHEKKAFFLHVWLSKVLVLEITFHEQKTTSKKTSFFLFGQQSNASKIKTKCLVCLCLSFKTSLRTTEVQHLLLFFRTSNQKVVLCTNEKFFFSLYFSFTRKQSSQQTNCFFFVNKTILKWETETKQKRSWTSPSVFLLILFAFCHPRQNKKTRFYKSEETIVRTTLALFEVWKTFLSLHCWFFWAKTVWN